MFLHVGAICLGQRRKLRSFAHRPVVAADEKPTKSCQMDSVVRIVHVEQTHHVNVRFLDAVGHRHIDQLEMWSSHRVTRRGRRNAASIWSNATTLSISPSRGPVRVEIVVKGYRYDTASGMKIKGLL